MKKTNARPSSSARVLPSEVLYLVVHHPVEAGHVVTVVEERGLSDLAVGQPHLVQHDVHPLLDTAVSHHLLQQLHLLALGRHQRRHHQLPGRVLDELQ